MYTKTARAALVAVSVLAAASIGGGFILGIVLSPLLVVAAHQASRLGAWGYGLIAGILAAELGWAATYLLAGELEPTIWLLPTILGLASLSAAVLVGNRGRQAAHR